jgi:hypothetical protein
VKFGYTGRSSLGEHRPDYEWVCGICGKQIIGKANTIHLAIGSHIDSEWRKGIRKTRYSIHNDSGHKY